MNNSLSLTSDYRRPPTVETALNLGMALTTILPVYAAWRIARWIVMRAFKVLLIAVSQLSAAWQSGKADKSS